MFISFIISFLLQCKRSDSFPERDSLYIKSVLHWSQVRCDSQSEASMIVLMLAIGCCNRLAIDLRLM